MSLLQNSNAISSGGYNIANSLRFQSASSQSLTRTFTTPTDAKKWTWSGWVKRGNLATDQVFFGSAVSTAGFNESRLCFLANNTIRLLFQNGSSTAAELVTTQVFRDPSAWYHIVVVADTNNATSSDRVILYINGSRVTAFSTATYPSLSASFNFNTAVQHALGAGYTTATQTTPNFGFTDGYMTEVNFIDGQALTPSSFGETNTLTGQWVAKKYAGTYGTNGFYLPFSNGTSTTTLGADSSGNGNNWTLNNFTRSAGVSDCWMIDVPSGNGGASGTQPSSNYCVLSPIDKDSTVTISKGNLTQTSSAGGAAKSSIFIPTTGKWYAEYICTVGSTISLKIQNYAGKYIGYLNSGSKETSGGSSAYGASWTTNDVIGVAVDCDTSQITFYKNNASQGAIAFSVDSLTSENLFFTNYTANSSATVNANFGQRSFAYTPPTGFKALCTANLPAATIQKGNQYMDATLYTGNGSTQSIVNAAGFAPDLVWIKTRSNTYSHNIEDTVRGTSKNLQSDSTAAEGTGNNGAVTAFNSNGFTIAAGASSILEVGANGATYVAWQWDAGSSTVTNTSGTISSQVRANPTAGVSVVTYTGTGSAASIGHGLGVSPEFIIVKRRDTTANWMVVSKYLTNYNWYLKLNLTDAQVGDATIGNIDPTSTIFNVGTNAINNASGGTYVAYVWAPIAGFSKFGSYTGNGSADGTFVYTGFRPRFVMIKNAGLADNWCMYDTARNTGNVSNLFLVAQGANAEQTGLEIDILSNGFKARTTNDNVNSSSYSYIYMAFAENPFANSNAR